MHALSDVRDGFLLRLPGVSLWPCAGCAVPRCASCTPPDRICASALFSVLGALCCVLQRHILHSFMCEDVPSDSWLEHPTEGFDARDRSLWPFAAHVSSTMAGLMLSQHHSLCSLTSALVCAVLHTCLESSPAGCTREYASCVHCTTVWSESCFENGTKLLCSMCCAFHTLVVRGKTSCVPYLFLSCTAAQASPRMHLNSAIRSSAEYREASSSRLRCIDFCRMFEASPPHLPRSSRASTTSLAVCRLLVNASRLHRLNCARGFACWLLAARSTSELSRSLISSMSFARGTHHHVLDLALLHPTAAQLGLRGSTVYAYGHVLPGLFHHASVGFFT